ncbi:MAG: histidine phosphatase family protein [Pseudomonadales bacterium]|jgi:probable phosphoglycerate mutase
MKQIYVIRHGQTEWNLARRMQGRLDSPLTQEGMEQAHRHGALLKTLDRIETMYVSPSGRTRETAYIINSYVRARVEYVDALLERDVGLWSGLTVDELEDAFPQAWRQRSEDPYNHRPPEGESLADMSERVARFVAEVLNGPERGVALVTHQVMSRVILGNLLGLLPEEVARVLHPNEAFYRVEIDETADVSHFLAGRGPFDGLLRHGDGETIPPLNR